MDEYDEMDECEESQLPEMDVSADREAILDAVDALMKCIPRCWTYRMVETAAIAAVEVASAWRHDFERKEDMQEVIHAYLTTRLGLSEAEAYSGGVVAE